MTISPRRRVVSGVSSAPPSISDPLVEETVVALPRRHRLVWGAVCLAAVAGLVAGYVYIAPVRVAAISWGGRLPAVFSLVSRKGGKPPVITPVAHPAAQPVIDSACLVAVDVRADQIARLAMAGAVDPSMMSPDSLPSWSNLPCPQRLDSLTAMLADQVVARELYTPGEHGEMVEKSDSELRRAAALRSPLARTRRLQPVAGPAVTPVR